MINQNITASFFEYEQNQSENINDRKANNINNDDDIYIKSPYEWTCDEVIKWINTTPFSNKSKKFKKGNINGSKLFTLDRVCLQNDLKIFDAKARRGILLSIQKLKHEWRELQKQKTEKWVNTHSNTLKSNKNTSTITNEESHSNRIYIQIRRNENTFNDISNYSIQHILQFYDLISVNKQLSLNSIIKTNDMDLIDCLFNDTITVKQRTIFIFIIHHNIQPNKYIYLITKNIKDWTIQNVFIYFSKINNGKYNSFAKQLKKKQINGIKLIKFTRKTLHDDFINYTDSLLRKHIYNEIQILLDSHSHSHINIPKTYHNYIKPTQSEIEKQRIQKQKLKKLGPRDIGQNKHYKQITYSLNENDFQTSFLNERICVSSQYNNFKKRQKLNPIIPNETVEQIGNNKHYQQITYELTENDLTGGFLNERIHPLSKDNKFQFRKQEMEINNNNNLSIDNNIVINNHFKGISYEMRDSEIMGSFLNENIHPLSKDIRFQKRKQQNLLSLKQSVSDICIDNDFEGINYEMRESEIMGTFLNERIHPMSKDNKFQKRKQQNPLIPKESVKQIGNNKHYIQISYQLRNSQLIGPFLSYRCDYLSKDINFQKRKEMNPIIHNETVSQIGTNKHYESISYELSNNNNKLNSEPFPEKEWYQSSKIYDNNGLSWLLRNLPAHKLRIMDKMPLPTGAHTKIVWLRKLKDLIADELAECSKKNSNQNIAYSSLLKKQLSELNEMLIKLSDE